MSRKSLDTESRRHGDAGKELTPPSPRPRVPASPRPSSPTPTPKDFASHRPTWCPGCGDFAVVKATQEALAELGRQPDQVAVVAGIGCSGKISEYIRSHGFHTLHGRTLPVASGIKLANRGLTVLAMSGDGDGYGIGLSHFIHAGRRNVDLTYVVMDNAVYGNTKGQTSPTSNQGYVSGSTPFGAAELPIRPLPLALAAGIGYVAQGWSGNPKQLAQLIADGIRHPGFALVNVFSPCVTFDRVHTYPWYREHVLDLQADLQHDPADLISALRLAHESEPVYVGLLYRAERPSYESLLPCFPEQPLAGLDLRPETHDWRSAMLEQFGVEALDR